MPRIQHTSSSRVGPSHYPNPFPSDGLELGKILTRVSNSGVLRTEASPAVVVTLGPIRRSQQEISNNHIPFPQRMTGFRRSLFCLLLIASTSSVILGVLIYKLSTLMNINTQSAPELDDQSRLRFINQLNDGLRAFSSVIHDPVNYTFYEDSGLQGACIDVKDLAPAVQLTVSQVFSQALREFNGYLADLGYSELGFIMVDSFNQSCRVQAHILNQSEIIAAHTDFSENTAGFSTQNINSVSSIGRIIGLSDTEMINPRREDDSKNLALHELIHAFGQRVVIVKNNKIVQFLSAHHEYRGVMNPEGGSWSEADRYLLEAHAIQVREIHRFFHP